MFDSSYFLGKIPFEDDGSQNCLVFQVVYKQFTMVANTNKVSAWKIKGLFNVSIKPSSKSDDSLNPGINYIDNAKIQVQVDGRYSKPEKITLTQKIISDFYIIKKVK